MPKLCILLHAHLPYVRNTSTLLPLEEVWLYQNIAECYIPLIQMCKKLVKKDIAPSISLSLSPTLLTMLQQKYYHTRFKNWAAVMLDAVALLKKKNDRAHAALNFYHDFIINSLSYFEKINGDCVNAFGELFKTNSIELLTTAGTHPFFPLFRNYSFLLGLQIQAGIHLFERNFDTMPQGFWIPELGYFTGIDSCLCTHSIAYTFVNDRSVLLAKNLPSTANFFPAKTPLGLVVFPRDAVLSMKIWSSHSGYPGHPVYREFHHDAMYELQELSPQFEHRQLGLKIYAITGTQQKEYYDPEKAKQIVQIHVDDFINTILTRASDVTRIIKRAPVFMVPFDAELFGHWWFEGPLFLELLIEAIASRDDIACVTPQELLKADMEIIEPVESSWGKGNDFSTWYNAKVRWYVMELEKLLYRFGRVVHENTAAVQQCARELMLAMASDWQFMISTQSFPDYAQKRIEDHIHASSTILDIIERGIRNDAYIQDRFEKYPVFDDIGSIIAGALR
ncbi:MAG: DUF1957 domain-containing protein [Spirochaetes bacterium]|nr:DUF1957 domain-containing protein [Spirochaetota bacterium]